MEKQSAVITQSEKERPPIRLLRGSGLCDRIQELSNSIAGRAFELFNGRTRADGHNLEDRFKAKLESLHPVHLDVAESGDSVTVGVEAPGFKPKELEVSLEPHRLTISGRRETSEDYREQCLKAYVQRLVGDEIYRAIDLPAAVDTSKVTATLKDGVLKLWMPKAATAQKVLVKEKAA